MANRATPATQQETLSPPWQLSAFDTNWNSPITALNDASLGYLNAMPVDTGVANAYAVTLPFGSPTAYQDGMSVVFIPANTNTGASTMTVSPLGAAAVLNPAGIALQGGELAANRAFLLIYKSASPVGFRILGTCPLSIAPSTASTTLSIECAGYTSVNAYVTFSGVGITITLAHLAQGVPVTLTVVNASGASRGVAFAATNPAGTAFTSIAAVTSGTATGVAGIDMIVTGVVLLNGVAMVFTGGAQAPLQAIFAK